MKGERRISGFLDRRTSDVREVRLRRRDRRKSGMFDRRAEPRAIAGDPLWYKDAIIYELHVRAFCDSNGDGIGDFAGLTSKLDYLKDLGVTALWLLPFYPSPLKDDGYDIARYTEVHPSYGTLQDFRDFLREAHARGLKVITELVLNHTSDQHEWFQRSRRAKPGSKWRNYYVWSDSPQVYQDARIIFRDFETSNWSWDPIAKAYYWHRFYAHQPDLNWDLPEVQRAMFRIVDFWLRLGIDGLRLDAVPYLIEREGTSCENLPETHTILKKLRQHVEEGFKDRMLLAEANQWPDDAVAYLGEECHMAFHFPLMPRLFMAIGLEERFPIVDIVEQTPAIPQANQWALFLRNHDELTLEMVTDEDRDYMYRRYAHDPQARINLGIRRRLAPLVQNDRGTLRLLNGLLLSFAGTPVLYYGDEIAMGDNIYLGDRNGVRTPMQWSADRNAGFSRANPQRLYLPIIIDPEYHYEAHNVEAQQASTSSFLWWMKRLIALRQQHKHVFGRGSFEILQPKNRKVLAFVRRYEGEVVLVVANLSRFPQAVELDLHAFKQRVPVEMFGRTDFPAVGEQPYVLTLAAHDFFWFVLEARPGPEQRSEAHNEGPPLLRADDLQRLASGELSAAMNVLFMRYLPTRRWFARKASPLKVITISDVQRLGRDDAALVVIAAEHHDGHKDNYVITVAAAFGEEAARIERDLPAVILARLEGGGVLYEGLWSQGFQRALLAAIVKRKPLRGSGGGELRAFGRALDIDPETAEASVLQGEQSNSALLYSTPSGARFFCKLYRRLQPGAQPEVEIGRALEAQRSFTQYVPLHGWLEHEGKSADESQVVSLLQSAIEAEDAWRYTLDALGRYLDAALGGAPPTQELVGPYLQDCALMGRRVAELHVALAAAPGEAFCPEPSSPHYRQSLYQSMRTQARKALHLLAERAPHLPAGVRADADRVLASEREILRRLQLVPHTKSPALRIRGHGDLHLGQLLYTGKDFVLVDFEGEPTRTLTERRIKRMVLRDVAGMLRSFSYAAMTAVFGAGTREQDTAAALVATREWTRFVSAAFWHAYETGVSGTHLLPNATELPILLDAFLIEKALYELSYELAMRPEWVRVPLLGLIDLLTPA